ncbi:MAG: hypothetical protein H0W64_09130 [Gammaproteobacteria bacterium]|nr:hypothetical protein [Gammaproteobacteria bacterium]
MNKFKPIVALVGATGDVGLKILEIMTQRNFFKLNRIKCFSSLTKWFKNKNRFITSTMLMDVSLQG